MMVGAAMAAAVLPRKLLREVSFFIVGKFNRVGWGR
jgi:hypothetical protein